MSAKETKETAAKGDDLPQSPKNEEDRCPVCLNNQIDDLSRLDGCRHAFCYRCIVWWMGVKTECPLCKARVTKVSHNFRAPTNGTGESLFDVITTRELRDQFEVARIQAETSHADLNAERGEVVRLVRRLRTSLRSLDDIAERWKGKGKIRRWRILLANREVLVEWINRFQLLIDDFDQPRRLVISNPSFRAVVYDSLLHRVAIVDANNDRERSRAISPNFFVENRAEQFGRIAEFVRRELAVLSELPAKLSVEVVPRSAVEIPFSFSTLGRVPPESVKMESQVGRVYELMCEHQINAPMFASTLLREGIVGGAHVNHFVELLFDFVSSFQSLDLFDENSRYLSDSLWRERQRQRQRIVDNYGDAGEDDVLFYSEVLRPSGSRSPADALGPSPSPSSHRFQRRAGPSAPSPLTHRLYRMFRSTPYFANPIAKRAIVERTPAVASSISYTTSLHRGDRCSLNSGSAVGENDITGWASAKDHDDNANEVVLHERWPTITIDDEDDLVGNVADVAAPNRDYGPSSLRSPPREIGLVDPLAQPDALRLITRVFESSARQFEQEGRALREQNEVLQRKLLDCQKKTLSFMQGEQVSNAHAVALYLNDILKTTSLR